MSRLIRYNGKFYAIAGLTILMVYWPTPAAAFCPLCVIASGTIMGFFRWLGVDDIIVGLWLGGLAVSSIALTHKWVVKKYGFRDWQLPLIIIAWSGLIAAILYINHFFNTYNLFWGIYKIIFGLGVGSLITLLVIPLDKWLRRKNHGQRFISHQKMILTISLLIIFSWIFYLIIKYY